MHTDHTRVCSPSHAWVESEGKDESDTVILHGQGNCGLIGFSCMDIYSYVVE